MDSYLHIFIRQIQDGKFRGADLNLAGTVDISLRIKLQGKAQDTKICKGEIKSVSFNEPLILEDVEPDGGESKLEIEVWDVDTSTADDLLAVAELTLPDRYALNVGETTIALKHPSKGDIIGTLIVDQIHFVKQKVRRYMGPCKCCCCCLEKGVDSQAEYKMMNQAAQTQQAVQAANE